MADNTTKCPHCGARVWYAEDRLDANGTMRCVCGDRFAPVELTEFITGAEKRRRQNEATTAKPSKPRTAPKKATK